MKETGEIPSHTEEHLFTFCGYRDRKAFKRCLGRWYGRQCVGWGGKVDYYSDQGIGPDVRSWVSVNDTWAEESEVKVEAHQGYVLRPLLFIMGAEGFVEWF